MHSVCMYLVTNILHYSQTIIMNTGKVPKLTRWRRHSRESTTKPNVHVNSPDNTSTSMRRHRGSSLFLPYLCLYNKYYIPYKLKRTLHNTVLGWHLSQFSSHLSRLYLTPLSAQLWISVMLNIFLHQFLKAVRIGAVLVRIHCTQAS